MAENKSENLIVGQHYPAIDGLRGIAVLLVLWFHSSYFVTIGTEFNLEGFTYYYYILTIIGETGVDLFFVLSGFLITGILIDTANDKHVFKNFYIRRSLRIFPLYYTVLSIFLIYFILILGLNNIDNWKIFTHIFYIQNWSLIHNDDQFMLLDHTWSLAVEEQFYLFWPLLFLFFYEKGQGVKQVFFICLFMICFSWFLRLYFMDLNRHKFAYTFTISRLDGLALGALLSVVCVHYKDLLLKYRFIFVALIWFLVLLLLSVLLVSESIDDAHYEATRVGLMICVVLYTCLLAYIFLSEKSFLKYLLAKPLLISVGKYSYGIYIFHVPIMMIIVKNLYSYDLSYWYAHIILLLSGNIISFILAYFSYNLFEKRFLRLKDKYAPLNNS